jgi:hypothetical protein
MKFVITIFNTKTKIGAVIYATHPERIDEIEDGLEEHEIMFVNEIE